MPATPTIFISRQQRRRMGGGPFDTAVISAGENLAAHPRAIAFNDALSTWRRAPTRNCICCETALTEVPVAGFLLVAAHNREVSLAAAICVECFDAENIDKLEAAAERVLRAFAPSGRFLDDHKNNAAAPEHGSGGEVDRTTNAASALTDANTTTNQQGDDYVQIGT